MILLVFSSYTLTMQQPSSANCVYQKLNQAFNQDLERIYPLDPAQFKKFFEKPVFQMKPELLTELLNGGFLYNTIVKSKTQELKPKITILKELGVNVNSEVYPNLGVTVLEGVSMGACKSGNLKGVNCLLELGADPIFRISDNYDSALSSMSSFVLYPELKHAKSVYDLLAKHTDWKKVTTAPSWESTFNLLSSSDPATYKHKMNIFFPCGLPHQIGALAALKVFEKDTNIESLSKKCNILVSLREKYSTK